MNLDIMRDGLPAYLRGVPVLLDGVDNAVIFSLTELAPLGTSEWDYEDRRRVVIQRNAVTRVRPAMKAWPGKVGCAKVWQALWRGRAGCGRARQGGHRRGVVRYGGA